MYENYLRVQFLQISSIESDTRVVHLPCEVYIARRLEIAMLCSSFLSTTAFYFSSLISCITKVDVLIGSVSHCSNARSRNLGDQEGNVRKQILLLLLSTSSAELIHFML
jgi:hypothetical protein